ncbi:MAG: DUF5658 family protein [Phycisphaerae bacterium]|jgi:hypothetical protein
MVCTEASSARSFRLVLILSIVCVLHAFDLALTRTQIEAGCFIEANRLAAMLMDSPAGLMLYKAGLLGAGVLILLAVRRHWQAEFGAWLLLVMAVGVMFWWAYYLHYRAVCLADPAQLSCTLTF